jgi:hypothetical protein
VRAQGADMADHQGGRLGHRPAADMIRQGVYAVVFRTQRLRYIQPTATAAADLAAAYATAYKGTVSKGADEAAATAVKCRTSCSCPDVQYDNLQSSRMSAALALL